MKKIRLALVMLMTLTMIMGSTIIVSADGAKKGITPVTEWSSVDENGNMFVFVMVRNDNSSDRIVSMNASSYNASGKKIESASSETIYLGAGETYALVSTFDKSGNATNYDYDLIVDNDISSYNLSNGTPCLDAKFSDDGKGTVTVYATNTSPYTVTAQAMVIYYQDNSVVDFQEICLSNDSDLQLYPGEATTEYVYSEYVYDASTILVTGIR